jgi:hypothetical protein
LEALLLYKGYLLSKIFFGSFTVIQRLFVIKKNLFGSFTVIQRLFVIKDFFFGSFTVIQRLIVIKEVSKKKSLITIIKEIQLYKWLKNK